VQHGAYGLRGRKRKREIPEVLNDVIIGHGLIPPEDQLLIHLFDAGKGAITVADDVGVREVMIGRKVDQCLLLTSSQTP
jgi:hypothetical protein